MGTLSFTAPSFNLNSPYTIRNGQVVSGPLPVSKTITLEVEGLQEEWRVIRAVLYVTINGIGAFGSNKTYCRIDTTDVSSNYQSPRENVIRMNVRSNRTVTAEAQFRSNAIASTDGVHNVTISFSDIHLDIDYSEDSQIAPITEDDLTVMVPVRDVVLFPKNAQTFGMGGIMLQPTECTVSEEANGAYDLEMTHPFDPAERWKMLTEEAIIKAPIPPTVIPAVTMPAAPVWRVKSSVTSTSLYSKLPSYAAAKGPLDDIKNNPGKYAWSQTANYAVGAYVTQSGNIYQCEIANTEHSPAMYTPDYWRYIDTVSGGSGTGYYDPGKIVEELDSEEMVTFVGDYNSTWMRVRSRLGRVGYVRRKDMEETGTSEIITTEHRILYTQLFRIYSVECDEAAGTVSVSARHISYDLQSNMLFDCQATEAYPPTVIALIQGAMINDDTLNNEARMIACDIDDVQISGDWSFQNPIQALLDPENGLAAQAEAKVLRDNRDFFILSNLLQRGGPRLAYGVNLRGVKWTRNVEDVVTRIIPRAKDKDGEYLYLDELYIDSEHINDYALIRTEVLDSKYSVGQKIDKADGKQITLSRDAVIERMRQEAEDRYFVDYCDAVTVTLDVDFVLLGDTEEFRQYRNLQRLNLFDLVQIDTGSMSVSAQVKAYEWDSLAGRYKRITIGTVYSQQRARIPGYRVARGAITYDKLAPALVNRLKGDDD